MTDRLLVECGADGLVTVREWPSGELYPTVAAQAAPLRWPLDKHDLEELRWYLEQYLSTPFGVYGDRGSAVETQLPVWGARIFKAVFAAGPARDAYVRARARGGPTEVVILSATAGPLGLPWELMADPARPTPLALDRVAVSRGLLTAQSTAVSQATGSRLRVLMVISRPDGPQDVGYRMIARPMLRRLAPIRDEVDLVVLRPPTLDRLGEVLAEARAAGEPFQIVHFDGHGVFGHAPRPVDRFTPQTDDGLGSRGMLAFEHPRGGQDLVPAEQVARLLTQAQVPIVVLNACRSAVVGARVEATVATRLLQEGTAAVVAMAYSVYAVAAAEFMAAFYERLLSGDRVTEAVAAGRTRLATADERPSPKGLLPLADWMVPVLYARSEAGFPWLRARPESATSVGRDTVPPGPREREDTDGAPEENAGVDLELAAEAEFVGRDALFHTLESAARLQRVVVLHGPAGIGKTELAKAFGRWFRDTGAVDAPELVIWHSFEPGVASFGLDGVINAVGRHLPDEDFPRLDRVARRARVENALRTRRMLLIWDNFETAHSMPGPARATPLLSEPERAELRAFLSRVAAGGRSAVLVTSRTEEQWLGNIRRVAVPGLEPEEAHEYADQLLAPYPQARRRRETRSFGELMSWLDGHPLSLRLILPHLETTDARDLLGALRGATPLPESSDGGRTGSLTASIAYSLGHLSDADQQALTVLTLFRGAADSNLLAAYSRVPGCPAPYRGHSAHEWEGLLARAARVGLLTSLGTGQYRIHPALPSHLSGPSSLRATTGSPVEPSAIDPAFLEACGMFGDWATQQLESGEADLALDLLHHNRLTLSAALAHAVDQGLWEDAQFVAQALHQYWALQGMFAERQAWADRVRLAVETVDGEPPATGTPARALWLFMTGTQAQDHTDARRLDEAEHAVRDLLGVLEDDGEDRQDSQYADIQLQLGTVLLLKGRLEEGKERYAEALAIRLRIGDHHGVAESHHHLGLAAEQQDRLDEAEQHYTAALTFNTGLGNLQRTAANHGQLGSVALRRGRLDDAERHYLQTFTISQQLDDLTTAAGALHQLGRVAYERGQLDEAEDRYRQALTIAEHVGGDSDTATAHHQLGLVAQERGRLADAEKWYLGAARANEALGDRVRLAITYHQLGTVTGQLKRFDDAEAWCRKSLDITEKLGDLRGMAPTYHLMGLLAWEQGDHVKSLTWTVRCLALSDRCTHPALGRALEHLPRFTQVMDRTVFEQTWRATTDALPMTVIHHILSAEPRPTDTE
ncbi:tetratricopeptide repeat protein [Streptomyces sp. MB09-01]|uniref:CHAT domain-containing tetratricopeptide repeat protein n=1 Tax=Streptomyces sp. MB09-01 TaxID=3028666 RepID=UPI0029AC3BCE|nr:tetratricopeptide repeat protein [Streptomyces sp. MB09-01]MDX3538946.1 tetratricopeptide repeat protein [Streptomyces sp. MB09-01]